MVVAVEQIEEEFESGDEESGEEEEMEVEGEGEEEDEEHISNSKSKGGLDKFWLLSNAKTNTSRIDASSKIIKRLVSNPSESNYIMKRLLRGLASPVETSRQGFFICLVEFFRLNKMEASKLNSEIKTTLKVTGSKGEESLLLLGQILANVALLRAGVPETKPEKVQVLENLIENGSKRGYLNLIVINAIIEYFLQEGSVITPTEVVDAIGNSFKLKISEAGLDSLLFSIAFIKLHGKTVPAEFLVEHFGIKDVSKKNLESIYKIVMGTTIPLSMIVNHPLLKVLVEIVSEKKLGAKFFNHFTPDMAGSTYKGQIGIAVLREFLKNDPCMVEELVSVETLKSLLFLCGKGVVNPVVEILDMVEETVKQEKANCWVMLSRFLEASVCWDKHVPGNTVTFLFSLSDSDTLLKAGDYLLQIFKSDVQVSDRIYAAGLLAKLVGHPSVISSVDWRVSILSSLMELTLITVPGDKTPQLTKEAKIQLREVFYRGLDSTCKTLVDNVNLVHALLQHAQQLLEKQGVTQKTMKEDCKETWAKVVSTVGKLGKRWKEKATKETGVFLMFFSHIGLQLFVQPEMAIDVLSELQPVYTNWSKSKPAKGDPAGIEVVIEIMLSLLAQNKHILRKLVNVVFKVVCDQLTEPALASILAVLGPEEAEEESGDEDDDEDEDEEEGDEEEDKEESGDEEEEDSDDDVENEDEDEEMKPEDLDKVKKALGEHADAENSDIDMDDIPDEDMDNLDKKLVEAFKALGGGKSSSEKKKEKLGHLARQHFKLRVLELLEIYINHKPTVEHIFSIISALIQSFQNIFTQHREAQLVSRIKLVLRKCSSVKFESCQGFDSNPVLEYLLNLGTNASSTVVSLGIIHARLCLTALRIAVPDNAEQSEALYLTALTQFFENNQCLLSPEVFQAAVGIPWTGAISLAQVVAEKSFDPKVRHFRRSQGLSILSSFVNNRQMETLSPGRKKVIIEDAMKKILALIEGGLEKAKPKQLMEIFSILRGVKQQDLISAKTIKQVQEHLRVYAKSSLGIRGNNPVKKSLKKVLSYYDVKVEVVPQEEKEKKETNGTSEPQEIKKKKKKKKSKDSEKRRKEKKMEAAEADDSIPSFSDLLIDTTQVYKDENKKKKNKKRKNAELEVTTPPAQEKKKKKKKSE